MTRIISLQLLFMVLPIMALAQTNKDKKSSFREHLQAKEKQRKNAVKEYAKQNSIPITGTGVDGAYLYLHHIDNNKPVYYSTRGDDKNLYADAISAYIKMDKGEWKPLDNNVQLEKADNSFLSIKSNEEMTGVWMLDSKGHSVYRSKKLNTNLLMIPTKKIEQGEYVICVKTINTLSTQKVIIN